jgi:SAM-dependent methyltransferase
MIRSILEKCHAIRPKASARDTTPAARQVEVLEAVVRRVLARHYGAMPLPPEALRLHVGANTTAGNFWFKGIDSAIQVRKAFGEEPAAPILDWGCGSGRTFTFLRDHPAWRQHWTGCDIDAEAIAWLRSVGVERASVCSPNPPLPYPDGAFGGIFSFSVLTHIHPSQHRAWYAELRRLLRPGGQACLTTQGPYIVNRPDIRLPAAVVAHYREHGWAYHPKEGHCKDAALVTPEHNRRALSGLFEVVRYEDSGYHNMDAFLVRRID